MDIHGSFETQEREPPPAPDVRFSPVRTDKFVLLSLASLGIYPVVWLYRNWRYVRQAESSTLWPWARALFAPVWYYPLLRRLDVGGKVGLTAAFWIIESTWRLPDPYWWLSTLGFLPLLPAVAAVNRLNEDAPSHPSFRWRRRSWAALAGGVLFAPLAAIGTLGPSTAVVAGADVTAGELAFLREEGLLEPDEQVLYFYSTGLLSIRGEGVMATDLGVTSYWTDPVTEELSAAYLPYSDIDDIETNPSTHPLEDTVVRITGADGFWFMFYLSAEGGGDQRFLEEVHRRMSQTQRPLTTA